jgi:hypothetical protein
VSTDVVQMHVILQRTNANLIHEIRQLIALSGNLNVNAIDTLTVRGVQLQRRATIAQQ